MKKMSDNSKELDLMIDVIIPSGLVIGLFLLNAIILFIIYRKRKMISHDNDDEIFNVIGSATASASASASASSSSSPSPSSSLPLPLPLASASASPSLSLSATNERNDVRSSSCVGVRQSLRIANTNANDVNTGKVAATIADKIHDDNNDSGATKEDGIGIGINEETDNITNGGASTSNSGISFIRTFTITSLSTTSNTPTATIHTDEIDVNAIEMDRL